MRTLTAVILALSLLGPVPASAQNSPPQRPGTVRRHGRNPSSRPRWDTGSPVRRTCPRKR